MDTTQKTRFQIDNTEPRSVGRAVLVVLSIASNRSNSDDPDLAAQRCDAARLEEAIGLAAAIDLEVVHSGIVTLQKVKPGTLLGVGKVEEIKGIVAALDAGLVIVDHPLSPVQQRNLENAWEAKVLDRTGLILEIFGARAQTKEGRLQVELAHLNYQRGRLVRSWTHLERQRGGGGGSGGFLGGPGETQIESDRRQLQERIDSLKKDLAKVSRTRSLHRAKRKRVPHPVIALVGYTNAGKSTLFNRLTGAGVVAKDMLFATLDPTLRRLELPQGTLAIFSDTVGFVSDLPTHLVAAFRATLEEVIEADLILHVRDAANPDSGAQAQDVYAVLDQLGIGDDGHRNVIEVWNKIDLLHPSQLESMRETRKCEEGPFFVSAITGEGIDDLLPAVENRVAGSHALREIRLGLDAMGNLDWIYSNTQVVDRIDNDDGSLQLTLRVAPAVQEELESRLA
ncbi:MAG: GTPase HflX [Rhizobiaceae bacterium]